MKAIKQLLNSSTSKTIGNHSKELSQDGNVIKYIYHVTAIVIVNQLDRTITIDNGGYGTSSTTRAINSYLKSPEINDLHNNGYEIIDKRSQ